MLFNFSLYVLPSVRMTVLNEIDADECRERKILLLIWIEDFAILHPFASSIGFRENDFEVEIFFFQRFDILQSTFNSECR